MPSQRANYSCTNKYSLVTKSNYKPPRVIRCEMNMGKMQVFLTLKFEQYIISLVLLAESFGAMGIQSVIHRNSTQSAGTEWRTSGSIDIPKWPCKRINNYSLASLIDFQSLAEWLKMLVVQEKERYETAQNFQKWQVIMKMEVWSHLHRREGN